MYVHMSQRVVTVHLMFSKVMGSLELVPNVLSCCRVAPDLDGWQEVVQGSKTEYTALQDEQQGPCAGSTLSPVPEKEVSKPKFSR